MSAQLENFELWARAQIVASISWPVSFLTISSLASVMDLSHPTLPILWLLGLGMGGITALSSGLVVKRQISGTRQWAVANFVGIPVSLTFAYLTFPFVGSPLGFAAVGLCSGLITSAAQSLALKQGHSKVAPLITGTFGWALAFLFGYLLVVQGLMVTFVFMPSDFFSALLLGWGVSGPFFLIMFLGLSPLSRERTSSGSGIRFN